jgi:hypothetical protein
MAIEDKSIGDLEFAKFLETPEGDIAVRAVSQDQYLTRDPREKYALKDLEYKKFIETPDGIAVRIFDINGGSGGGGQYIPKPWETQAILNNATMPIQFIMLANSIYIKIKMYSKRVSDTETRMAYQEFFLIKDQGLWTWHENYYTAIKTGWDGLTFSVNTNAGLPQLYYTSNNMAGIYDLANSNMRYQLEEVV